MLARLRAARDTGGMDDALQIGDRVLVLQGVFSRFSGIVQGNLPDGQIQIGVNAFGTTTPVILPPHFVEREKESDPPE